ncbi:MAG: hypothetical protein ABIY55_33455 [Kofleriaceae bacterium]
MAIGCGAGETRIDPADLELRDLLGVAPEVAVRWDDAQRASARRVLAEGLRAPATRHTIAIEAGETADDRLIRTLAALDAARATEGEGALGLVQLVIGARELTAIARDGETAATMARGGAPISELVLAEAWRSHAWGYLPGRGRAVLAALAADAGHATGAVVIVPATRLSVIASYDPTAAPSPRLMVNPIVLAALEPEADEAAVTAAMARPAAGPAPIAAIAASPSAALAGTPAVAPAVIPAVNAAAPGAAGNPYSFYGSVAECAFAQRTHCDACVAAGTCQPVTDISDGNAECMRLGETEGRGYFLLCVNLALAIHAIDDCAARTATACPRSTAAAGSLATLEANAEFLDDPACGEPLDACLAELYGAPPGEFPGVDGGTAPPAPPRDTSLNCQDSCSNDNSNHTCTGPSVDCTGPSCNNSLSCDSACSSSNDQSGCGGNCDSCNSSSSSSSGGGCSSGSSSSSSNGCGGDSCGGSSCGSGCGGGDSSKCSSGGNGCAVAKQDAAPGAALLISILWALLPVPAAALVRRRARRRPRDTPEGGEPSPASPDTASPDTASPEEAL